MKRLLVLAAVMLTALAGYVLHALATGNLHAVVPAQLYRSAQMSERSLGRTIQQHAIRCVLNLRGPSSESWYHAETNTTGRLGVAHVDFPMSEHRELSDGEAATLATILRTSPKPLLVHCQGGADRTGLASALFLLESGASEARARKQLSLFYGHFPHLKWQPAIAMDRTFARYVSNRISLATSLK